MVSELMKSISNTWNRVRYAVTGRGSVGDHMNSRIQGPSIRVQGLFSSAEANVWDTVMALPRWDDRITTLIWMEDTEPRTRITKPRQDIMKAMASALEAAEPALVYRNALMQTEAELAALIPALRKHHRDLWSMATENGTTSRSAFEIAKIVLVDIITRADTEAMERSKGIQD